MRRRDVTPRDTGDPRPSPVSRDRLASRVQRDVADVRTRLEEAVLRQDALLAAGQPDRAAAVVDEQHALMDELREQVEASVAAAIVEAQAESVLASAPDAEALFGVVEGETGDVAPGVVELAPRRSLRGAVSAALSAVAALALLVMAGSPPEPSTLAAAGVDDEVRGAEESRATQDEHTAVDRRTAEDADPRAIGPNELEVRELFAAPGPGGDRRRGLGIGVTTGMGELQSLLDSLLASVARAADAARSDADAVWRAVRSEATDGGSESDAASAEPEDGAAPAAGEEQVAEPAAEDPSGSEAPDDGGPSEADGGLPGEDVLDDRVDPTGLDQNP